MTTIHKFHNPRLPSPTRYSGHVERILGPRASGIDIKRPVLAMALYIFGTGLALCFMALGLNRWLDLVPAFLLVAGVVVAAGE